MYPKSCCDTPHTRARHKQASTFSGFTNHALSCSHFHCSYLSQQATVKYITYYVDTIFFLVHLVWHIQFIYIERLFHFIKSSWKYARKWLTVYCPQCPTPYLTLHEWPRYHPLRSFWLFQTVEWLCVIGFIQPHYKASAIFSFIYLMFANTFWGQKNTRWNVL